MTPKKLNHVLFFVLFSLTSQLPATLTFSETFYSALDYWGVGVVGAVIATAGFTLNCCIKCCCARRRAKRIKRALSAFDAKKLLDGMAAITKRHLDKSSDSNALIFTGTLATDPSWYIISGARMTNYLAKSIQQPRSPLDTSIHGLVLIGASFDHALLADHSTHSDVSTKDLSVIANHCIDHKIPLLVLYLGQDAHAQHVPEFGLSTLTIPSTHTLFDDPRARLREHHSLTVESLLEAFGPAIAAKAIQFSVHYRGAESYPVGKLCKHETNRFIESLRNYAEDEVAVTVDHEA